MATRKAASRKAVTGKAAAAKSSRGKPSAKPDKPAKAAKPAKPGKPSRPSLPAEAIPAVAKPKQKLIRDSFTIPKNEYVVLDVLKQRCLASGRAAKKSEILRAGINVLQGMSDAALLAALAVIPQLKTGRPKDAKKAPRRG